MIATPRGLLGRLRTSDALSSVRATEHQRGSVIVEFAISSSLFFMLIMALIGFGYAMFTYDLVENASKLGARYAIVRGTTCASVTPHNTPCPATSANVTTYVQAQSPGVTANSLTVTATWGPSTNSGCPVVGSPGPTTYQAPGCLVTVAVSYPFKFFWFSSLTMTMQSQSQMTISQ